MEILNIENDVANVKVESSLYVDYLQEIMLDGQWKIVNVIFTSGLNGPPRLRDFDAGAERTAIEKTAMNYLTGLSATDAGRLQESIDPEFSRISLLPVPQNGKTSLRRQRYQDVMERALAGIGKQDEIYRNNRVHILDVLDGLAVVRCETASTVETVQMYKGDGQWKILNSIVRPNSDLTLQKALTVIAGEPMPDFTLPVYGGRDFHLLDYQGKKVMLVFPRGFLGNGWCAYCPYQYLELEQLEKKEQIMSKYNVQIAFVMPYGMEMIQDWLADFPVALAAIERNKNPQPTPAAGSLQADYSNWVKEHFPLTFEVKAEDAHTIIPVLSDEDRELSRQLKIFTGFWDGISAEQNIASVFIIDQKGILRFKYIGQMTEDRPSVAYLLRIIKEMK
jgi:peroxiredoxin